MGKAARFAGIQATGKMNAPTTLKIRGWDFKKKGSFGKSGQKGGKKGGGKGKVAWPYQPYYNSWENSGSWKGKGSYPSSGSGPAPMDIGNAYLGGGFQAPAAAPPTQSHGDQQQQAQGGKVQNISLGAGVWSMGCYDVTRKDPIRTHNSWEKSYLGDEFWGCDGEDQTWDPPPVTEEIFGRPRRQEKMDQGDTDAHR